MGGAKALPRAVLEQAHKAFVATKTKANPAGNYCAAARQLGLDGMTLRRRVEMYVAGRSAEAKAAKRPARDEYLRVLADMLRQNPATSANDFRSSAPISEPDRFLSEFGSWNQFKAAATALAGIPDLAVRDRVRGALRRGGTLEDLAGSARATRGQVLDAIDQIRAGGSVVDEFGGRFGIGKSMAPAFTDTRGPTFTYQSRKDNTFLFGACGDSHLGSKYERMDVLNDLYDRYEKAGVDRVFHTGNWVDGDEPKNRHDIAVHGMEPQLAYLARHYPQRKGIITYAVTGEDHEGWWTRTEGIDIGKRAEQTMREHGRADWVNLGFMESHIRLVNAKSGKESILAVVHPGGGTGYALSYTVQKIIEALEGGEKPAVALYGHYHKLWAGNIRNVWVVQTGCTQDQTIFTRNKIRQEVHVGGTLIELEQDPRTGAIIGMTPRLQRYFVKGYYNNRWNRATPVVLPERKVA